MPKIFVKLFHKSIAKITTTTGESIVERFH